MLPTLRRVFVSLALISSAAAAAFSGGCSSLPPANGPTVGVRNDSDAPLRATFWIGDRNDQRPGQRAEMAAQETMEIPPFGTKQFKLGAFSGYESAAESFVRVQIQPVGTSFQPAAQQWFELNPPSPFTVRVHGVKPNLLFERVGGGTMVAVPSDLWFRNATTPAATAASAAGPVRVYSGADRFQTGSKYLATPATSGRTPNTGVATTSTSPTNPAATGSVRVYSGTPHNPMITGKRLNQPATPGKTTPTPPTPITTVPTEQRGGND